MSFIAAASRRVTATRAACFARFADFGSWRTWMPKSFKPLEGPTRALRVGDPMTIRIDAGFPILAKVKVIRVEEGREITWRGGVGGVLVGEHSFFFDDEGEGATKVRSEETWSGALANVGFLAKRIKKAAEQIGEQQLEGFARDIEAK